MKLFTSAALVLTLAACGGGGGGDGGGTSSSSSSSLYSCSGNGYNYVCVPINGGGGPTPTPAAAQAFPMATSIQSLVRTGLTAKGLYTDPYTQAGTFAVTKSPSTTTFNGQSVTQLRTTSTWPSVSTIIPSWSGYVTPYDLYYDSNNQLYGFRINGIYGLKTSGSANPVSVNDGSTGTLSSYNLYTDEALTIFNGTATLTYSVVNCCDLWSKTKATMKLTIQANSTTNPWTLTQGFVVTTSGGISFSGEQITDTTTKRIFYPTGGY